MSDTLTLGALGVRCPVLLDRLHVSAGDEILPSGTRLITWIRPPRKPGTAGERGDVTLPFGGALVRWETAQGTTIDNADQPIASIERCKHPVEWGGLCASCGDEVGSYSVRLTHDAAGPTVSHEEAHRIELETAERLVRARKLSLIVDLDQTVVHATVDPTVGEWIAQGEPNPNSHALRDVKRFILADASTPEGCCYYIKPRPGLVSFLNELSTKYEMHVYTMGTRAYAMNVCAAIDPDGALFGGRILSRDESGSMTHKNIERLFPVDQSMVVIIDDRADVWDTHQNNLVKVIPYDFFVGIGDINAGLLPKQQEALSLPPGAPSNTAPPNPPTPPAAPAPAPQTESTPNNTEANATETEPEQTSPVIETTELSAEPSNSEVTDQPPTEPPTPAAPTESISGSSRSDEADTSDPNDTPRADASTTPQPQPQPQGLVIDLPPPSDAPTTDSLPTPSLLSSPSPSLDEAATLSSARAKLEAKGKGDRSGEGEAEEAAAVRESIIEAVMEERPLAKKQEALEGSGSPEVEMNDGRAQSSSGAETAGNADSRSGNSGPSGGKALLRDDDRELERIYSVLDEIHSRFFQSYDTEWGSGGRKGRSYTGSRGFNVQRIIPDIKRRVLAGVHILFSSVIPINANPTSSEYWRQSELFGAKCHTRLGPQITHVVAAKRGTEKVNQARARGGIAVVRPEWLHRVVTTWTHAPEEDFLLDLGDREEFVRRREAANSLNGNKDAGKSGGNRGDRNDEPDEGEGTEAGGSKSASVAGVEVDEESREQVDDILHGFDYQAELDALMDSDTETDDGSVSGVSARTSRRSTPAPPSSQPQTQPSTQSQPLKRQRSVTPSISTSGPGVSLADVDDPLTRSPLAKRKRLSEMRGSSRLGAQVVANGDVGVDVDGMDEGETVNGVTGFEMATTASPEDKEESDDEEEDGEEDSSDESEIVDFLAEDFFGEDNQDNEES